MTVEELIDLLDGTNQKYQVKLDIPYELEDSFITDTVTKTIYLACFPTPDEPTED